MDSIIADYKEYISKLQSNQDIVSSLTKLKKTVAEVIASRGYSDRSIAGFLGVSNEAVSLWRKKA
jgi:predicted transcriptional regulator